MYTRLCIIMFVESSAVNNIDVVWPQIKFYENVLENVNVYWYPGGGGTCGQCINVLTSHRRKIIIVN